MSVRALAIAAVLGPAATLASAARVGNVKLAATAAASALVVAFAISRLSGVTRGYRRSQERERLLRESAVALVAANDRA